MRGALLVVLAIGASLAALASSAPAYAGTSAFRDRLAAHALTALSRHEARSRSRSRLAGERRALAGALGLDLGASAFAPADAARPLTGGSGGEIEGEATSQVSKAPLAGVEVCATEPESAIGREELPFVKCSTTEASGRYSIAELPPGHYVVEFSAPVGSGLNYQTQFYEGHAHEREANLVDVESGVVVTAIDAALLPGGEIEGTVRSAVTGASYAEALVCAFEESSEAGGCAITAPDGSYTIAGLATGSYTVVFVPLEEEESLVTYAVQFYENEPTEALANLVGVVAGEPPTTKIDASLHESVPRMRSAPAIEGSTVVGATLTAVHASWTNSPTSIVDEWGRCSTSAIESCFTIAKGASYTLTASDVGHTIRIRERAFDATGESQPAFSAATAVVAARPLVAAGAPPGPALVAPASGVLPSTSAKASTAQLRSLLASLLAPKGRNAKIAQLLKHRGYTVSFTALSAGKLTISWYLVPKGAHLAAAKPVLAALGSVSSTAPGAAKLTIKLTAAGKRLLAHARRLALTAKGVLVPSGAPALGAKRAFTLEH